MTEQEKLWEAFKDLASMKRVLKDINDRQLISKWDQPRRGDEPGPKPKG